MLTIRPGSFSLGGPKKNVIQPVPGATGRCFSSSFSFAWIARSRGEPNLSFIHLANAAYSTVCVVVGCRTSTVNRPRGGVQSIALGASWIARRRPALQKIDVDFRLPGE